MFIAGVRQRTRVAGFAVSAQVMTTARNRHIRANALTPPIDRPVTIGILMTNDTPRTECPACHLLHHQVGALGFRLREIGLGHLQIGGLVGGERQLFGDARLFWRTRWGGGKRRRLDRTNGLGACFVGTLLNAAFTAAEEAISEASLQPGTPGQNLGLCRLGGALGMVAHVIALRGHAAGWHIAHVTAFERPLAADDIPVPGSVKIAPRGRRQQAAACGSELNDSDLAS